MAHEKLSPRQKMIGMMYLVLTAMLALNVSKDVVKAFMKVDKGLSLTVENYAKKNNVIYADFDRAAAENPAKAGPYRNKAFEIKTRADEVFNFLQELKIEIIKTAEGDENTPAVEGMTYDIELVKRYDENNVPSEILVGANENGKAYTLRALINEYREYLKEVLEGKNPSIAESLDKILNTDDAKNEDNEIEPWPNLMFQTLPVVGATAILTKMQVDVRNAETEVLNYLYGQIDASSFKFNKLNAIVIPKSNYVTVGSNYEATVFISATDTTQQPTITVGEQQLPVDETGKGQYTARATAVGPRTWGGVISMKSPDGTVKTYPFTESYNIGEPNVICSPTAMNVMYAGIENPLDVSVPGVDPQNIKVRVVNGTYSAKKIKTPRGDFFRGNWAVKPEAPGKAVQVLVSTDIEGKVTNYAPYEFRVKPVPPPEAILGGRSSGTISRNIAVAQEGVFARLPDFDFDLIYEITGFTMIYTDRMGDKYEVSNSSSFTPAQKAILNQLTRGKTLVITDIKAKGPDGIKEVKSIVLKID